MKTLVKQDSSQLFTFGKHQIRVILIDGEPWWVLKDVCDALDINNSRMVADRLDEDEKGVSITDALGGEQKLTTINESGLYDLLFSMQPQKANHDGGVSDAYPLEIQKRIEQLHRFKRWVTHEVLPSIRKTASKLTVEAVETAKGVEPDSGPNFKLGRHEDENPALLKLQSGSQGDLQVFNRQEFGDIRFVDLNGKPYAVGVDVARALDYSKPGQAVINHCKGILKLGIPSGKGTQETNIIPEGDIYRLTVKAADQSRSPKVKTKAQKFEHWIFDEVLPSIRKTGSYGQPRKLSILDAAKELVASLEREEQLRLQAVKDRPKVIFADAVSVSDGTILIGELAKILKGNGVDIGQNRLYERLRQDVFLIRRQGSDYNAPTQRAMELGLFKVKETAITHSDGHVSISKTTKVTGKGQQYFINFYLRPRQVAR